MSADPEALPSPIPLTEVVYYWRRDDLIKIGTTRNLTSRMRRLRPGDLLAVEPGGYSIERGRHTLFADYHQATPDGVEWFRPGPLLVWHIEAMANLYPVSLIDDLPHMRVPAAQRAPGRPIPAAEIDALRRLQTWVELLPEIVKAHAEPPAEDRRRHGAEGEQQP